MRALSVQQPWAWAIAAGFKTTENRSRMQGWRSAVGQTIALHAGKTWSKRGAVFEPLVDAYLERTGLTLPLPDDHPIVYGAVIATVDVVDVHFARPDCCQPWGEPSYFDGTQQVNVVHLSLANARTLRDPVPWRGQLGLFDVPDDVIRKAT